jgi:hypothetical protein
MKRRDFITLLGGTVAAWPLAARVGARTKIVPGLEICDGAVPVAFETVRLLR